MCLTGYLIGDLWDQNAFLKECERANEKVAALSKGLTIVWGSLAVDWDLINDDGRPRKYNAAFAASNGHFIYPEGSPLPFTVKTLLPDYRCFDDRRYFTSLESLALEEGKRPEDILAPFVLPAGKKSSAAASSSAKTAGMKTTAFPRCPSSQKKAFPCS